MTRLNHIGSLLTFWVVSILLICILYRWVLSFSAFEPVKEFTLLKQKTDSTAALNTQLLYEEREGEDETESFCDDDESRAERFVIRVIDAYVSDNSLQVFQIRLRRASVTMSFKPRAYLLNRSILV